MTDADAKELLDLARKAAVGDAQSHELLSACDWLMQHTGRLLDENALLRLELGGDVTARVRAAAYRAVQAELMRHDIVGVNNVGDGTWRALSGGDAEDVTAGSMMAAVDAARERT